MEYDIKFDLMEMVVLSGACSDAIDKEHKNFIRILRNNGEAIRNLESAREKILAALRENHHNVNLTLMETVQLYAACNMAWHYEIAEREKQHAECRLAQYTKSIAELENAREAILEALHR